MIVPAWCLLAVLAASGPEGREGDAPQPLFEWTADASLGADSPPAAAAFRDGLAARFERAQAAFLSLGQGAEGSLRLEGAFTLAAVVQIGKEAPGKVSLISKWRLSRGGRSYELGIVDSRLATSIALAPDFASISEVDCRGADGAHGADGAPGRSSRGIRGRRRGRRRRRGGLPRVARQLVALFRWQRTPRSQALTPQIGPARVARQWCWTRTRTRACGGSSAMRPISRARRVRPRCRRSSCTSHRAGCRPWSLRSPAGCTASRVGGADSRSPTSGSRHRTSGGSAP